MNYVIRNNQSNLFLGVTQNREGYHQSWNALDTCIQFSSEQRALDFCVFQGYDTLVGVNYSVVPLSEATLEVKPSKLGFFARLFVIGLILLSGFAEKNYTNALTASALCSGSDGAIMETMNQYGFNVDPLADIEPTMVEKVSALYVSNF